MDFDTAFQRVIGHEGGFQARHDDPGNYTPGGSIKGTKYGISARSYPGEDIEGMTLQRAKEIYRRDFWGPAGCDGLPPAIRFDIFDCAVNSGVRQAVKLLQRAVGETQDGILGPRTLQAASSMPAPRLVARFNAERLEFMTGTKGWEAFGKGWARRIAANLRTA